MWSVPEDQQQCLCCYLAISKEVVFLLSLLKFLSILNSPEGSSLVDRKEPMAKCDGSEKIADTLLLFLKPNLGCSKK